MRRHASVVVAFALAAAAGIGGAAFSSDLAGSATAEGEDVVLSGQLTVMWGDPQPGSNLQPRITYTLTDRAMRKTELTIDDATVQQAGGVLAINRKWVTVTGRTMAPGRSAARGQTPRIRVTSIALTARMDQSETMEAAVTGAQPWVSIMCKFSDSAAEPRDLAFFQGMYRNTSPGLNHYWKELSYDIANVDGSSAAGWYVLPNPRSYYVYDMDGDGDVDLNATRARQDCTAAADPYVDYTTVVGINMMFNENLDCCAWGGGSMMTLDGVYKFWSVTYEPPWAYADISVIAHEMGHGFGLPHSSGQYGYTYDNAWDVMSWDRVNCVDDPVYGCPAQHTISYHKDLLGWLPGRRYEVAPGTSATLVIDQLATPSTGYQMVKAPVSGESTHFLTVEARRRVGYDSKLPGDAVIIHDVVTNRVGGKPAQVIDADGNGHTNDAGAMWTTGETYTNAAAGIRVRVNSATATGFTVTIANGVPLPLLTGADFNGDVKPDIVWRDRTTGEIIVWFMDGNTYSSYARVAGAPDANWTLAATADFDLDGRNDFLWRNNVTGANAIWHLYGTAYISYTPVLAVADLNWKIAGAADFNGDSKPDIVWHNAVTGANSVWYMNGASYVSYANLTTEPNLNWRLVGIDDFDANGAPDLLWRNAITGENRVWLMSGATLSSSVALASQTDLRWTMAGTGDYNSDGQVDILWRNTSTGENAAWYMNGTTYVSTGSILSVTDTNWDVLHEEDTAVSNPQDFNGDGKPDILWRNVSTGENIIWYMNGATYVGYGRVATVTPVTWQSAATADFNGDGKPDIVWHNTATGETIIWYMNGSAYVSYARVNTVADTNWKIVGAADVNADGKPDIFWRNAATGENIVWHMNGSAYVSYARVTTVDVAWKIAGLADFNADGRPDILWRNLTTGENIVWYMNGTTYVSYARIDTVADLTWRLAGAADFNADGKPDLLWRNATTGRNIVWYMNGATYVSYAGILGVADTNWKTGSDLQ